MANKFTVNDLRDFTGVEGFHFREDIRHNLTDVTLPKTYEIVSKNIVCGRLKKIEFRDDRGNHFVYEDEG